MIEQGESERRVKVVQPGAVVEENRELLAYHRYSVMSGPGSAWRLGGGPTPEEAWRNAEIHMTAIVRFLEGRREGSVSNRT